MLGLPESSKYPPFHPGDPMFVTDRTGANPHRILISKPGIHNHYPVWSRDGQWIYFVQGSVTTNETDLWRISPDGGKLERLTQHNSEVRDPSPLDTRTVVYAARDHDGSGPWLWALDVNRKTTQRISSGLETYISVSASADGRHLVATESSPIPSLWSVPILNRVAEEQDAKPYPVGTVRALGPRFGGTRCFICLLAVPVTACGGSRTARPRRSGMVPTERCWTLRPFPPTDGAWQSHFAATGN